MILNIVFMLFNVFFITNYVCGQTASRKLGYEMIPGTKGQYKLHRSPKPGDDAKWTCKSEEAVLFYPDTKREARMVIAFYDTEEGLFPKELAIGLQKEDFTFVTINGTLITKDETSLKWYSGEPNNQGSREHCVEILAFYAKTYNWLINDIPCEMKNNFICKTLIYSSSTHYNYEEILGVNGWYKFHNIPKSWDDAKSTCESENAVFFYPDTETEAVTVLNYFGSNRLFTGLRKAKNNKFTIINGTLITKESTSIPWLSGRPTAQRNQNCVKMMNVDGSWVLSDYPCYEQRPFVCESPLNYTVPVEVQFKIIPFENQLLCDTIDKKNYEVIVMEGVSLKIKVGSKYFIDYVICADYYDSNIIFQGTPAYRSNILKVPKITEAMTGKWNCTILTLQDIKGLGSPIVYYKGYNYAAVYCTVQVKVITDDLSPVTKSPIENLYKELPKTLTTTMPSLQKQETTEFSLENPEITTRNSIQNPATTAKASLQNPLDDQAHECKEVKALKTEIENLKAKADIEVYEKYIEKCCKTAVLQSMKYKFDFLECDPNCFKISEDPFKML